MRRNLHKRGVVLIALCGLTISALGVVPACAAGSVDGVSPDHAAAIARLTYDSDFTKYLGKNVPAAEHRMAMRKLWHTSPIFQTRDNLDNYRSGIAMNAAPAAPAPVAAIAPVAGPLPAIATLSFESDYRPFVAPGVPVEAQRAALRKLWRSNPIFASDDRLDIYRGEDTKDPQEQRLARNDRVTN
jgi:hypothetical protein